MSSASATLPACDMRRRREGQTSQAGSAVPDREAPLRASHRSDLYRRSDFLSGIAPPRKPSAGKFNSTANELPAAPKDRFQLQRPLELKSLFKTRQFFARAWQHSRGNAKFVARKMARAERDDYHMQLQNPIVAVFAPHRIRSGGKAKDILDTTHPVYLAVQAGEVPETATV